MIRSPPVNRETISRRARMTKLSEDLVTTTMTVTLPNVPMGNVALPLVPFVPDSPESVVQEHLVRRVSA